MLAPVVALCHCTEPAVEASDPAAKGEQPAARGSAVDFSVEEIRRILQHSPLKTPPADPTNRHAGDPRAALLGHSLYFDKRLSGNGQVSCATCHDPAKGFADGRPLPEGMSTGTRHAPSIWNAAYNRWYFWDGRADSLWAQAIGPLERDAEHGFNRLALAHVIGADPHYRAAYESIFGPLPPLDDGRRFPSAGMPTPDEPGSELGAAWEGMSAQDREEIDRVLVNAAKSIAAYETQIVSRRSPFDVFVEGLRENDAEKLAALSASAQRGLRTFIGKGECRVCHSGPNFTDGEFHSVRVAPLADGGDAADAGRFVGAQRVMADPFNAAGKFSDDANGAGKQKLEFLANPPENWGRFKTPSLRNVALTAPYMHQGQFARLDDVIAHYSTFEGALPPGHHDETILKPLQLTQSERDDLRAFLEVLTDADIDPALLKAPTARLSGSAPAAGTHAMDSADAGR